MKTIETKLELLGKDIATTMASQTFPRGTDFARVIQIIETKSAVGSGSNDDPTRFITQYWSLDGKKLATADPVCGQPTCQPPPE